VKSNYEKLRYAEARVKLSLWLVKLHALKKQKLEAVEK
jgi:hypothetical protein